MSQDLITALKIELAVRDKSKAWLARKLELSAVYVNEILDGTKKGGPQVKRMEIILSELRAGKYDKEV